LKILASQGVKIDICCLWFSESGHGGPTLSPQQLSKLGELGIDLWFDFTDRKTAAITARRDSTLVLKYPTLYSLANILKRHRSERTENKKHN
jgi:hypothetical protein